jgi:hypothetical protein
MQDSLNRDAVAFRCEQIGRAAAIYSEPRPLATKDNICAAGQAPCFA